ncbi:unnamed protein product [Calicophoron daubneyi]|uniref:RBR-type E3 ubiquitin transferase n=1 Tax=Calicophoron daubneyi TaxID=300641 RepID=A0AAV2TG91_CALDB
MPDSGALELQTAELECLASTFGDSDPHVSFKFDAKTRNGCICVFPALAEEQQIHLHCPNVKLVLRNTQQLPEEEGRRGSVFVLHYLPAIVVNFIFRNNYPGTMSKPIAPKFSLQSIWLPKPILNQMVGKLNEIVHDNPGELVLWQFIDFLRNEAVCYMINCAYGSAEVLNLNLDVLYEMYGEDMDLSVSQCTEILLMNNDDRYDVEFDIKTWDCPVCFESKLGSLFFRFPKCKHAICLECVRTFFMEVVKEGMMSQQMSCLQCGEEAGPAEARVVLSSDEFAAYEALQLKRGLSLMQDITTCPRPGCDTCVILDDPDLGRCPKNGGCNKMVCQYCKTYFCWICAQVINDRSNPYKHFSSGKCKDKLWLGVNTDEMVDIGLMEHCHKSDVMCEPSPLELQTAELECLFSTFKDSDIHVSLNFDEETRQGWISVYCELVDGQRIHLHGCDTSIVPRNTEKLTDGDDVVYLLKSLPPIRVNFIFQNEYPGTVSKPVSLEFSVESAWLPKPILDRVYERLNEIVHANPGELVLWEFIDYLRNEAVYCILNCEDRSVKALDLNLEVLYEEYGEYMDMCISECTEMLLLNNDDRFDVEFEIGMWDCPVCCESKIGSLFFRFPKCKHAVCLECVNEYFLGVIKDGMMSQQMRCLQCGEETGPSEARAVLSAEDYARFEALQLKRGLSMMRDIGTCPRPGCNTSVILDDPNLGRCPTCRLAFCPHCLRTYHGVAKCFMFDNQPRKDKICTYLEEKASKAYMDKNCNPCPKCRAPCEKNGGCNKMVCQYCQTYFCWICMKIIKNTTDPYKHFSSGKCKNKLWVEENTGNG